MHTQSIKQQAHAALAHHRTSQSPPPHHPSPTLLQHTCRSPRNTPRLGRLFPRAPALALPTRSKLKLPLHTPAHEQSRAQCAAPCPSCLKQEARADCGGVADKGRAATPPPPRPEERRPSTRSRAPGASRRSDGEAARLLPLLGANARQANPVVVRLWASIVAVHPALATYSGAKAPLGAMHVAVRQGRTCSGWSWRGGLAAQGDADGETLRAKRGCAL
jgi:hypothetical protein